MMSVGQPPIFTFGPRPLPAPLSQRIAVTQIAIAPDAIPEVVKLSKIKVQMYLKLQHFWVSSRDYRQESKLMNGFTPQALHT